MAMARKGQGIFLVYTDIEPQHEEEFNAWYNTEHLPELLSLPGFLDAARYVAYKGVPRYLAVYELENAEALKSAEFQKWRANPSPWSRRISPTVIGKNLSRAVGQQIFPGNPEMPDRGIAAALQIGRMSVPEAVDREWNTWYNGEYIPGYRKVPGVIYARRYRVIDGETGYTTVYEFDNEHVSETAEWNKQREGSSPQSGRMRDVMTHLQGSPGVYRRIYPQ
jgi:antibiotic biosynthesis monooxygenase (ABM) superfamily enzyme